MKFKSIITLAILLTSIFYQAEAQKNSGSVKDSMARFSNMVGEWEGIAISTNKAGVKDTVYQHEKIEYSLNGVILNVEGTGYDSDGEVIFNAFATMFYDRKASAYAMNAYRSNGQITKADVEFTGPSSFIWSFSPNGKSQVKYEAEIRKDTWKEDGFFSRDGETWHPIFSMSLNKIEKEEK